ncbi:MAG: response regulator [Myxococcota bacterium]
MRLRDARILVIDDHPDLVENLQEILEDEGAVVMTATSAERGLELAASRFDVALVDVRLPDARGPQIVQRLKTGDALQEVLLVTGNASIHDAVEAVKSDAFAYILKPFDPEDLVANVERACRQVDLRRRAASLQSRLGRSEGALRTLVDTVQALLLVLDGDLRVVQANPAVSAATGLDLHAIVGADWLETCVPPRVRDELREAFNSLREHPGAVSIDGLITRQKSGGGVQERSISWQLAAQGEGSSFRIYASGLDVTDIAELERRTRMAEKLAAVGTVSAGLAHEIRNPLNAANLQLQLLERRLLKITDDPKLRGPLETVREEILRLGALVSDFLTFARPTAINARATNLCELVEHVASLERPEAAEAGIELVSSCEAAEIPVAVDRQRIEQVLLNLIRNALEAVRGRPDGRVSIHVGHDGAGARIVVRDNGPGIPDAVVSRIYEPFFTTKEAGTGLGMAIAHKIIDMHGGHLDIDGSDGASIAIVLPPSPPHPAPAGA